MILSMTLHEDPSNHHPDFPTKTPTPPNDKMFPPGSNEDGHVCWRSRFLNQHTPPEPIKDEEGPSIYSDAAKAGNSVRDSNRRCCSRSISSNCLLVQEANPRIAEDGDAAEMDASDAEAVKAEENEGDEDWVVVPGYSLPSPPTPSFPVKTHTPHYSPGQLKGEYRRKMVKEVLPELMDLYVLSLRLVLTLANLLADSLKLESAPLMRFGGVLVEKGKALVGNERVDRLAEGAKALVGKFEALREKKARYEFR
jgi:hypothetical protein